MYDMATELLGEAISDWLRGAAKAEDEELPAAELALRQMTGAIALSMVKEPVPISLGGLLRRLDRYSSSVVGGVSLQEAAIYTLLYEEVLTIDQENKLEFHPPESTQYRDCLKAFGEF